MKTRIYAYAFGIVLLEAICFIGLLILPFYLASLVRYRALAFLVLLLLFVPFMLLQRYRLDTHWKKIASGVIPAFLIITAALLFDSLDFVWIIVLVMVLS